MIQTSPGPSTHGSISYRILNPRTVQMAGSISLFNKEFNESGDIVRIFRRDGEDFKVPGIIIPKPKTPFRINHIDQISTGGKVIVPVNFNLSVARATKSMNFLLPLLGGYAAAYMNKTHLVNVFMGIENETEECIALLYRFSATSEFAKLEARLKSFENFLYVKDTDPHHVLYVFDVPDTGRSSYEAFRAGKYSEMDDMTKLGILRFHNYDMKGETAAILFKHPERREQLNEVLGATLPEDAELLSAPSLEQEIFRAEFYLTKTSKSNNSWL